MSKTSSTPAFDLGTLETLDTDQLEILTADGRPTGWFLDLAGPSHPETIALQTEAMFEEQRRRRGQEQAKVNGKKWTPPEEDVGATRKKLARSVARRIVGWGPAIFDGKEFPWSPDNAIALMENPRYGRVADQVFEFFGDAKAFTKRSTNS